MSHPRGDADTQRSFKTCLRSTTSILLRENLNPVHLAIEPKIWTLSYNGLLVFLLKEIILNLIQKVIDTAIYKVKKFVFFLLNYIIDITFSVYA